MDITVGHESGWGSNRWQPIFKLCLLNNVELLMSWRMSECPLSEYGNIPLWLLQWHGPYTYIYIYIYLHSHTHTHMYTLSCILLPFGMVTPGSIQSTGSFYCSTKSILKSSFILFKWCLLEWLSHWQNFWIYVYFHSYIIYNTEVYLTIPVFLYLHQSWRQVHSY